MSETQIAKALNGVVDIQQYLVGMSNDEPIGTRIINSDEFKTFKSGQREVASFPISPREHKSIIGTGAITDPLTAPFSPNIDPGKRRRIGVRDLIPAYSIQNAAVEMPTKTTAIIGSPAIQNREGTSFGESGFTFNDSSVPVETIGHTLQVSKQIFDDSGQLSAFINIELLHSLAERVQDQLLNGNGSNSSLNGLIAGATTYSLKSPNLSIEADIIRDAALQIEVADFYPTNIIMNPYDWYDIETKKVGTSDDTYASGTPRLMSGPTLWGLPVVTTNDIATGTFLVGDFNRAAALFERETAQVSISSHHADNFTKGTLTLKATERLALVILNSLALVTGSL